MLKIRGYYYDKIRDCVVEWKPAQKKNQIGNCRQSLSVDLISNCREPRRHTRVFGWVKLVSLLGHLHFEGIGYPIRDLASRSNGLYSLLEIGGFGKSQYKSL